MWCINLLVQSVGVWTWAVWAHVSAHWLSPAVLPPAWKYGVKYQWHRLDIAHGHMVSLVTWPVWVTSQQTPLYTTRDLTFIHHLHNNPGCQSGMKLCKNVWLMVLVECKTKLWMQNRSWFFESCVAPQVISISVWGSVLHMNFDEKLPQGYLWWGLSVI